MFNSSAEEENVQMDVLSSELEEIPLHIVQELTEETKKDDDFSHFGQEPRHSEQIEQNITEESNQIRISLIRY